MNRRGLLALLLPAAGAIVAALVMTRDGTGRFEAGGKDIVLFRDGGGTRADGIQVSYPTGTGLEFVLEDGSWNVVVAESRWPMKRERAAALFHSPDGVAEFPRNMQLVTSPGEAPASFRDQAGTTVVFLANGAPVETVIVGRVLRRGDVVRTEVRRRGDDHYYLARGNLADNFAGDSPADWIDAGFLDGLLPEAVAEVRVRAEDEGHSFSVRRSGGGGESQWSVESGGAFHPAMDDRVDRLVDSLLAMTPIGFPTSPPEDRVTATIEIATAEGEVRTIFVGEETEPGSGLWLAWNSDSDRPRAIYRPLAVLRDPHELIVGDQPSL